MDKKIKAVFNWSGGKDSALALLKVQKEERYDIVSLLTTVNRDEGRSSMHGIPVSLLERQADSLGFPLEIVRLNSGGGIAEYESSMESAVHKFLEKGAEHFIFGDIFLADVRRYREKQLSPYGVKVVEPLWGYGSVEVITEFISSGLKTIIVTTEARKLGKEFVGKLIDDKLIGSFSAGVDPCGENGEYHTFCFDGPIFKYPVQFSLGEPELRVHQVTTDDGKSERYEYWVANVNV